MRINKSKEEPMGIAYPPRPLAEPRSGRYAGCKSAAGEVFGCIPHGRGACRESDSFAMWAVHHGVTVSMTTVSISSDLFSPALQVRRDHRLVGVRRGTDKARARGVPPRAQVIATGGLRRRPQAVRAPTPEGISKMNDFFTMGSDPIVFIVLQGAAREHI